MKTNSMRSRLLTSSMICGAAFMALSGTAAYAQGEVSEVVVTGSRIVRQDYVANSPIATVTGDQAVANADITIDTYINTLPQINPAGTTSSNNPGNGGRSNVDLRGLGSNRNLVLIDGRRPMVSSNALTVDLNTIPQALIANIEVITGGAGATYGADAVAGVVNLKLKSNFEGVDIRASYSNSTEFRDAEEYQFSAAIGGNFADGKGNAAFAFDRAYRQPITKGQRPFSAFATATTGTPPEGAIRWGTASAGNGAGNAIPLAAIQALFGTPAYGSVAPGAITSTSGTLGTNLDGTLIYYGIANDPIRQVANYKYPIDTSVNTRFFPDFYSYNFDDPNLLILPMDRYTFMSKINYELDNGIKFFAQAGYTQYTAATALAPTPIPTVATVAVGSNTSREVSSLLVNPGALACPSTAGPGTVRCNIGTNLIVPVTNPFIPAALATLLAARTGDDARIVGSGATEPFLYGFRPVSIGPRLAQNTNTVVQYLGGMTIPISDTWELEGYISRGTTQIDLAQIGNIDTQKLSDVLASPTQNPAGSGGACATQNFFGDRPMNPACAAYILSNGAQRTVLEQSVGQAFVRGPIGKLPAGDVQSVFGVEYRGFEYSSRFLSNPGPFSGFNTADPEGGTNSFRDVFGELLIPILKDAPYAQTLELSLGARYSESEFYNKVKSIGRDARGSWAYKAELNWQPVDFARLRASYQRAVREPNFGELFAGGGSAPQVFDPCNTTSAAWQRSASVAPGSFRALCIAQGVSAVNGGGTPPGTQLSVNTLGNGDLDPEESDSFTFGAVVSSPWDNQWLERLRGSVDYYSIEITAPILGLDTNNALAACYNYFGGNPTYNPNYKYCAGLARAGGSLGSGTAYNNPAIATGEFPGVNGGVQKTTGVDIQLDWGFDWEWFGAPAWMGNLQANALVTRVLSFEQQDANDLQLVDYVGTISYFGAGLGTSFPEWKATINARWNLGDLSFGDLSAGLRSRYIGAMTNRQFAQFPGETFLGTTTNPNVSAIWYHDVDVTYGITDNVEFKLGVNNVMDKKPPIYAPNVQSGTDPSTYDTVGRRFFGQVKLRF